MVGLLPACLVELIAEALDLILGDGSVFGLGNLDELIEVVALDLAGDGSGHVGG